MIPDPGPSSDLATLVIYIAVLTLIEVIMIAIAVVGLCEVLGYSRDSDGKH